jgi:hypothetical protein
MVGKIKQIWAALDKCFEVNKSPLNIGQIVAWINLNYPNSDFNPVTLKAQIYRSCVNVPFAQKYNAPKILSYDKKSRLYSHVNEATAPNGSVSENGTELIPPPGFEEPDEFAVEDQSDLVVGVEAQLRDYLAKNLGKLETGLAFWSDSPPSVEYSIENRYIDILAKDVEGIPVVIELKRGRAYDRVVGQALLYQALVAEKFNAPKVRVILVANEITSELHLACSKQSDFKLYEYELTMKLNPVSSILTDEEV